ncbi:MAG: hypothetical protein ACE5KQ_00135 [Thermoplasmata archaeon]
MSPSLIRLGGGFIDEFADAGSSCPHEKVEFLGEDTSRNRYSRCRACGSILVHDRARVWVIRPGGPLEPHE